RLAVAGIAAIVVVSASYGFQDMAAPLATIRFRPGGVCARAAAALPGARLPVPAAFLQGLDLLSSGNPGGQRTYYLMGELSHAPWRTYHAIAYALKTPLPFLCLAIAGLVRALLPGRGSLAERSLAWAIVLVFAANAFLNPLNLGVRHVLPA